MTKQIGELELSDFDIAAVWASDVAGCDEESVRPRPDLAMIPSDTFGLWVRFTGSLSDGTPVAGIAMPESSPPSLRLHSFFIESAWHSLQLPPAPQFVLDAQGPEPFAQGLHRALTEVFPITLRTDIPVATNGKCIVQELNASGPIV